LIIINLYITKGAIKMDFKAIFNKRFWRPYSCAQYEPDEIMKVLATLAKKFTENLLYYKTITTDKKSFEITIMVPPFYNLQIYFHRFYMGCSWYDFNNFYIYKNKSSYYIMINRNHESFEIHKFNNNKLLQVKRNLSLCLFVKNNKYIIKKYIYYMDIFNNPIVINIIYKNHYYLKYNYYYIDNYIYKKRGTWRIDNKFIGNFLIIILFI